MEIESCKQAIDIIDEEYNVHRNSSELTKRVQAIVSETMDKYSDVLSFNEEQVNCIGVDSWSNNLSMATVVPVGVSYEPSDYSVSVEPEGCVVAVNKKAENYSLAATVRHELAHFEDWCRRQTTDEHDDEFTSLLEELDARENVW